MKKYLLWIVGIIVVLLVGFQALNAYIYQQKQGEPQPDPYVGWNTETTPEGVTFRYPNANFGPYVSAVEWPPILTIGEEYACGGVENVRDGITYCRTMSAEGAAGSTYRTYEYGVGIYRITFTLRYPQCENYDEPRRTECIAAQSSVEEDALAVKILSSVK
ncbi:MAG TPA: hypothetical protein VEB18_02270 [Candidatus Paceibacterota bacterium]|nr:hypothetical protein [Candidatus Paceibacterota bacterium]